MASATATGTAAAGGVDSLRAVLKSVPGIKLSEGAGVQITRTLGSAALRNLDPFLLLDELKVPAHQASAGFPDHPHRGFETCTVMLEGRMEHRDSCGNAGVIGPGGVQWMTAGRGLVHSEMPVAGQGGRLWGFQLWANLPAAHKMMKPRYQDYQASDIPVVTHGSSGAAVRVLAGSQGGTQGPIHTVNPGLLLDVVLPPGGGVRLEVPQGYTALAYVYDGAGSISGTMARLQHALVLGLGDHVTATAAPAAAAGADTATAATAEPAGAAPSSSASSSGGAADGGSDGFNTAAGGLKFLLVAGAPINEPIVQQGPFVMNSVREIAQAFDDFRAGRLQDPADDVWAAA